MGDEPAPLVFDDWYRLEYPRLCASLRLVSGDADLAADASAEAFTRAFARWKRVSRMASPTAWTYTVALNVVRRRLRRAGQERRLLRHVEAPAVAPPLSFDPDLWRAVQSLPEQQRIVLALRVLLDWPQEEVAAVLGVTSSTVSSTLVAARRRLTELAPRFSEVSDADARR